MSGALDPKKRTNLIPKGKKGTCRWCQKTVVPPRQTWCSQACVDDAMIRTQPSFARKKVEERDKGVCADCGLDTRVLENETRRLGALACSGMLAYCRTSDKASRRYQIEPYRLQNVIQAMVTDFEDAIREKKRAEYLAGGGIYSNHVQRVHPSQILAVTVKEQRVRRVHRRLKILAGLRLKRRIRELADAGFSGIYETGGWTRSPWDADHIIPVVKGGGGCGLENYRTLCQPCHKNRTAALAAERAAARRGTDPQQTFPL